MISLTSLLGDFDSLRQEREPLQPHAAIMLDEPKKKQYAALVVMFMLAGGEVNAKQERLLGLWLKALSLNASLADVLECAQQMNMDALRNAIAVIEQHDLVEHCLVDILVFIRIGGAIASRTGTNITNKLSGVKFKNCVANIGAVIYMHYAAEKTFYQCEIINCHSEMEFGNNNAGAIYLVDVENKFMNASTVINSNISLFDTYRHSRATFIVGSLLKQCTIFYSREDDNRNKYISEKTELNSGITNQQIKKHSSYLTKSLSF